MTDIERKFNIAMRDIYDKAMRECGYVATRLLQMLGEKGGVATSKGLISKPGATVLKVLQNFGNVEDWIFQLKLWF